MKFAPVLLGLLAVTLADVVLLGVFSEDASIRGFLAGVLEEPGLEYLTVSENGTYFTHHQNKLLKGEQNPDYGVSFSSGFLTYGNFTEPQVFAFDENNVMETRKDIWACMSSEDSTTKARGKYRILSGSRKPDRSCVQIHIYLEVIFEKIALQAVSKERDPECRGQLTAFPAKEKVLTLGTNGYGSRFSYMGNEVSTVANGDSIYKLGVLDGLVVLTPNVEPLWMEFDGNDKLITDKTFWACKNVGDDYGFSDVHKMIAVERSVGSHCEEVEIAIQRLSENTRKYKSRLLETDL